jgi:hypothetical protein
MIKKDKGSHSGLKINASLIYTRNGLAQDCSQILRGSHKKIVRITNKLLI